LRYAGIQVAGRGVPPYGGVPSTVPRLPQPHHVLWGQERGGLRRGEKAEAQRKGRQAEGVAVSPVEKAEGRQAGSAAGARGGAQVPPWQQVRAGAAGGARPAAAASRHIYGVARRRKKRHSQNSA